MSVEPMVRILQRGMSYINNLIVNEITVRIGLLESHYWDLFNHFKGYFWPESSGKKHLTVSEVVRLAMCEYFIVFLFLCWVISNSFLRSIVVYKYWYMGYEYYNLGWDGF